MSGSWDLIVRGGTLVDPGQGIHARRDVAFAGGRVAAVAERLDGPADDVIDATGRLVVPGLVDLHAHVYHGASIIATHADRDGLADGVTTAVDAGSAGWMTWAGFRDYVIPAYRSRVLAFLHLAATGLAVTRVMPELGDLRFAQADEAAAVAAAHPGQVLGIKVRLAHGATGRDDPANAREALRRARRAADLCRGRLMVHVSDSPLPLGEVLDALAPGDVVTHVFHGHAEGVLDADGRVRRDVRAAAERGVVLDVGHASVHCDATVARRALADGLFPTTISTDLHLPPPGRTVYRLRALLAKFVALGMSLEAVIAAATAAPARAVGHGDTLGGLAPGMAGDAVVLELEAGRFQFVDAAGHVVEADRHLRTRAVVVAGRRLETAPPAGDAVEPGRPPGA